MGKLGSFNHLRLTVSDVDRAAPFCLPVMRSLAPAWRNANLVE